MFEVALLEVTPSVEVIALFVCDLGDAKSMFTLRMCEDNPLKDFLDGNLLAVPVLVAHEALVAPAHQQKVKLLLYL